MNNRLLSFWSSILLFWCLALSPVRSTAQSPFYFNFTGPDTIFVDQNCKAVLEWGYPANPIVECLSNLCVITDINIVISGGYQIGDTIPLGTTIQVDYLAVDNQGNNLDTFFTIFFGDQTPPTFDSLFLPEPALSFACLSDVTPPVPADSLVAYDNCIALSDSNEIISISYDSVSTIMDSCSGGLLQRIWTATDAYGNSKSFTQEIIVQPDTIPPFFTAFPFSDTTSCDHVNYQGWLNAQRSFIAAVDQECGGVILSDNAPDSLSFSCGTQTVTFTAQDRCGNIRLVSVGYTVIDSVAPNIAPVSDTGILFSCSMPLSVVDSMIQHWHEKLVATDNCNKVNWTNSFSSFTDGCSKQTGIAPVWYVAADACGNKDSVKITFERVDTTAPVFILAPENKLFHCDTGTIEATLQNWLDHFGYAQVQDDCSFDSTLIKKIRFPGGTLVSAAALKDSLLEQYVCNPQQKLLFELSDSCGNTSFSETFVGFIDTLPPIWEKGPENLYIDCSNAFMADSLIQEWLGNQGSGLATEYCGGLFLENSFQGLTAKCGNTGFAEVWFVAADYCNNRDSAAAFIEIIDTLPPQVVSLPADTIISCELADANLLNWLDQKGGALLADLCDTAFWIGFTYSLPGWSSDTVSFGNYPQYPSPPDSICTWSLPVTFIFSDNCGNKNQVQATFKAVDKTPPVFQPLPDSLFASCNEIPPPNSPIVFDNCDPQPALQYTEKLFPGNCPGNYLLRRVWNASDLCGNKDSLIQWLVVRDTTGPQLSGVPQDIQVPCDNIPLPPVIGADIVATDNCDALPTIEFSSQSFQHPSPDSCQHYTYLIQRRWTATDHCLNQSELIQVLSVVDTVPPSFSTPPDVTISCEDALSGGLTGTPQNVSDQCNAPVTLSFTDDIEAGICPQNYKIIRSWIGTDVCGNTQTSIQVITVKDEQAPVLLQNTSSITLSCAPDDELESLFSEWVNENAGALAFDNCSPVNWFAAVPGSYDPGNPASFPGESAGALNDPECLTPVPGIYRQEEVLFIAFDECLNTSTSKSTFTVVDNSPPIIESCPADLTINTGVGSCDTLLMLPLPQFTDNCNAALIAIGPPMSGLSLVQNISSSVPGDFQTPVDPVTFTFGPLPSLPTYAASAAQLTIDLLLVDGEGTTEFFYIYGEDGSLLGITNPTDSQCGNSTTQLSITPQMINNWAVDEYITVTLQPNLPAGMSGAFAINDLCPAGPPTGGGSQVKATLEYEALQPSPVRLQYQINNGDTLSFPLLAPPAIPLEIGLHHFTYILTDCAGNATSCSFTLTIEDQRAPILHCPEDVTISITEDLDCATGVPFSLPFPVSLTDNCHFGSTTTLAQPSDSSASWLTFSYDPNYLDYIAEDKSFSFSNLPTNTAGSGVQLKVITKGDLDNPGEFFRIWGENNYLLGTNEIGQPHVTVNTGFCSPLTTPSLNEAIFFIPNQLFNSWAADGVLTITLESNKLFNQPPPGIFGDGISPFCTSFPTGSPDGTTDSLSQVFLELSFEQTEVGYYSQGATVIPPAVFPEFGVAPQHTFSQGSTTVFYTAKDQSGNADTCSFNVVVLDTLSPTALCQPITVFVNPSGVDDYLLTPEEIDAGSSDNCGIAEMQLSQTNINCQQAGSTLSITLNVTDNSGNSSFCNALVNVKTLPPQPTFVGGDCENDSLFFFANPPITSAPNNNFFTYSWIAPPSGLVFSNEENPTLYPVNPNNSGAYTLTLTGVTGCSASASLNINVGAQPQAPVLQSQSAYCLGEPISITTQAFSGSSVTYYWYLVQSSAPELLDSTSGPSINLTTLPGTGIFSIQGQVKVDGCWSNLSTPLSFEIFEIPTASTANAPVIEDCAGASIQLAAGNIQADLVYAWSGPDGFFHTGPVPPVLTNVDTFQSGVYYLTASNQACTSDPVETILIVKPRPKKPEIFGEHLFCENEPLTLFAAPEGSNSYTWISPFLNTLITSNSSISIAQADSSHDGSWTVFSIVDGCPSEEATGFSVTVAPKPVVQAGYNTPACENIPLQLAANFFSNANYEWTGPQGYAGFTQTPTAPPVSGIYSVKVISEAGCSGQASVEVIISEAPEITAISNTGNGSCVNGNTPIQLLSTVFPPNDGSYQFEWSGPDFFTSALQTAIIPNATADDSGPYNLLVTNGAGCSSEIATTTVSVYDIPPAPELVPAGQQAFCEGEPVTFSALGTYSGQTNYIWNTPLGSISSGNSSFTINSLSPVNSNDYSVVVIQNGCTSQPSNIADLTVHPKPAPPAFQVNPNPVCTGDSVQFLADFNPAATYQWIGPAGFDPQSFNPVIQQTSPIHAGGYALRVTINDCTSDYSDYTLLQVSPRPTPPILDSNSPVCGSDANAEILLFTSNGTTGNQSIYSWYYLPAGTKIGGSTTVDSLLITDLSTYPTGVHTFTATITDAGGCTSLPATPIEVQIDKTLNISAFAGDDQAVCKKISLQLNAENPTPAIGNWQQISGLPVSITNSQNPTTVISGLQNGQTYQFVWSLSNGACTNFSADTLLIRVDEDNQPALVGDNISLCDSNQVFLEAVAPLPGNSGSWSQSSQQAGAGIIIEHPDSFMTIVSNLSPGQYSFTWTLSNEGCGAFDSSELQALIGTSTGDEASVGPDLLACGTNLVTLQAQPVQFNSGQWSTIEPSIEIYFPDQNQTTASNLLPGENIFIWRIQNQSCGLTGTDTLVVTYDPGGQAYPDSAFTSFNLPVTILPVNNDSISFSGFEFTLLSEPENGLLSETNVAELLYAPNIPFTGLDYLTYEICSQLCPEICSEAIITILVESSEACEIPTIFTPNGDGVNDIFIIPCLAGNQYPNNTLTIFNEWGDEVYRSAPYQNNWAGLYNGEPLAIGTYYFVIDYGGDRPPQSGFLILER